MKKLNMLLASVAVSAFNNSDSCETVIIKRGSTNVRINRSDYDAERDGKEVDLNEIATGAAVETASVVVPAEGLSIPPAPSAPSFQAAPGADNVAQTDPIPPTTVAPDAILVNKDGKKFFAVTPQGEKITDKDGIEAKGYETEAAAWEAIFAYNAKQNATPTPPMPASATAPAE